MNARRIAVRLLVSIALGAAFLVWALWDVPLDEVWLAIFGGTVPEARLGPDGAGLVWRAVRVEGARLLLLLPYVASILLIQLMRTLRWGELLDPVSPVPFGRLWAVSQVGFAGIVLLPFRLGEFVRPTLIRDDKIRFSAALATCATERAADGLFIAAMIAVLVALLGGRSDIAPERIAELRWFGAFFGVFFGAVLVVLIFARTSKRLFLRLVGLLPGLLSRKAGALVDGFFATFVDGLAVLREPWRLVRFALYTLGYWGVNGLGYLLLFYAFDFDLDAVAGFTIMGLIVVGIFVPGGPGFLGNFEVFAKMGFGLFLPAAIVQTRGMAYILTLHFVQLFVLAALGLIYMNSRHVTLAGVVEAIRLMGRRTKGAAPAAGDAPQT